MLCPATDHAREAPRLLPRLSPGAPLLSLLSLLSLLALLAPVAPLATLGCHAGGADTSARDGGVASAASGKKPPPFAYHGVEDAGVSRAALLRERPYRRRAAPAGDAGAAPGHLPALLVALHGYGSSGAQLEKSLDLDGLADAHDYALAVPTAPPTARAAASGMPTTRAATSTTRRSTTSPTSAR